MRHIRRDPVTGRHVLICTERAQRPNATLRFSNEFDLDRDECPFCAGREHLTTPPIAIYSDELADESAEAWRVRVIPNMFPVLRVEETLEYTGHGMYDRISGVGAHEVIVETPKHGETFGNMSTRHIRTVLRAWSQRIFDLRRDIRIKHITLFKNHGLAAGATLSHSHSQLIGLPFVPHRMQEMLAGAERHHQQHERCVYCDMVHHEVSEGERLVHHTENFVVLCPYASAVPFETWIIPRQHISHFDGIDAGWLHDLAHVISSVIRRVDIALEKPAFNLVLESAPVSLGPLPHFHWHLRILPRITGYAGFEWASGCMINFTPPEEAAQFLHRIDP
ncbi:MAG: Galactose-1-phosphate uridylyltransferase [Myxococcota bacterium]|nr:Galactose-1-phosphate uridylyltransferase [Myxococcota bacterium]